VLVATTEDGAEGRTEVELASGASAEVELVLRATAELSGQVVDAEWNPVTGAQVSLREHRGYEATAADGRFTLRGLPAGSHTLRVRTQDHRSLERQVTLAEGQRLDLRELVVRGAAPDAGVQGQAQEQP
jgi:hypothetical protein